MPRLPDLLPVAGLKAGISKNDKKPASVTFFFSYKLTAVPLSIIFKELFSKESVYD